MVATEDDDWGEESYRGPELKTEANGVFMVNEAIMSYSIKTGADKFYFSLETKALNQTFNLYNKVYFGKQFAYRRRKTAAITDKRVRLTSEVLGGIMSIKAYVWEKAFLDMLGKLRRCVRSL